MNAINIDPIVNMVLSPTTHEDAAVAGFRIMHQNAASFGGLENMLSRSKDLLRLIAKRDKEIASLKAQVGQVQQALKLAEASRKAHAAEQAMEKECGSAWKRDPGSGVIGVEKGPLIPVV